MKQGTLFGRVIFLFPVLGLQETLAFLSLMRKLPNPPIITFSPFANEVVILDMKALTAKADSFLFKVVRSETWFIKSTFIKIKYLS